MRSKHQEWLASTKEFAISMIPRFFGGRRGEHPLLLLFQDDRSTVVVPPQIEIKTVMHQVSAADRPYLLHLARINGFDFVNGVLRKATQKHRRKRCAELLRVEKAKEHGLASIGGDILGSRRLAALRSDKAIQRSALHRNANTFVERNEASRRLHIL